MVFVGRREIRLGFGFFVFSGGADPKNLFHGGSGGFGDGGGGSQGALILDCEGRGRFDCFASDVPPSLCFFGLCFSVS
jgi:hypothetical protein